MAFSSTITDRGVFGSKRCAWGTYTNASSSTGGDIETGLESVEYIQLQEKGTAVQVAGGAVVNETLPVSGGITIVTVADDCGFWFAIGR